MTQVAAVETEQPPKRKRQFTAPSRRLRRALFSLVLLAFAIRCLGCFGQGLPYSYYGDEIFNVRQALRFGAEFTLDPSWFNKPSLGYYILFGEYGVYYLLGRLSGLFTNPQDFAQHYFDAPGAFYLIGRVSTAVFGALTVLLSYRLGKEVRGRFCGVLSALVLCLTLGHIASSQQVKMDVPATFFTAWAALFCLRVLKRGLRKDYLLAGVLTGLGTATKYYSIVLLVPFVFCHLFREPRALALNRRVWTSPRLGLGVFGWFLGFFVGAPYSFINPEFREGYILPRLRFVLRQTHQGWLSDLLTGSFFLQSRGSTVDIDRGATVWTVLEAMAQTLVSPGAVGAVIFILATCGFLSVLIRRSRRNAFVLLVIAMTVALLVTANNQYNAPRHLNTLYPFIAVLAAQGILAIGALSKHFTSRTIPGILVCLAALLAPYPGGPVWEVVAHEREMLRPDPRNEALAWIHANIPPGSVIINDHDRLPLRSTLGRLKWTQDRVATFARRRRFRRGWERSYPIELQFKRAAAERWGSDRYDTICMLHTWQDENLRKRPAAVATYNPLWPRSPWGGIWDRLAAEHRSGKKPLIDAAHTRALSHEYLRLPAFRNLAPVELWTHPSPVSWPYLLRDRSKTGLAQWQTPQWFVSAQESYDNYRTPHKRANFPDFADFYDDLKAHYDCHQFGELGTHRPEQVVRIYDLRQRINDRTPLVIRH